MENMTKHSAAVCVLKISHEVTGES